MKNYLEEDEYIIERLWFDYLGVRHRGRGVMKWHPDTGFHLEAFLERKKDLPRKIGFGGKSFIPLQSIRMYLRDDIRAIAPDVPLGDRLDIIIDKRISIDLRRVIFFYRSWTDRESNDWYCSALYDVGRELTLPNNVRYEEWLEDKQISEKHDRAGISLKNASSINVSGYMQENNHLEVHTKLLRSDWPRRASWSWIDAARLALSILAGRNICLLAREVFRGGDKYVEMKKREKVESLGSITPFNPQPFLDKNLFLWLTKFFVKQSEYFRICECIFFQMVGASQQLTLQARELLLSTILEASLRTIDQHPFRKGDYSWKIKDSINQFRKKYLSDEWIDACKRALEVRDRLRHRNAHPDWLISKGGSMSDEKITQSLDDMIFLSRFYGYMILAISGIKDLKPEFPKGHKEWSPLMTIARGAPNQ